MPWLDAAEPHGTAARKWQDAFKNAFRKRLSVTTFKQILSQLNAKYSCDSYEITRVLLGFRAQTTGADDALLFKYASTLLHANIITAQGLLIALLDTSHFGRSGEVRSANTPSIGLPTCEYRIFSMLTEMYMKDELHVRQQDLHGLINACTRWMHYVTEFELGKQLENGALYTADPYSFDTYEALALLLLTLLRKPTFRDLGKQKWWQSRRVLVVGEMIKFDTSVLQWMRSQWAGPLRQLTSSPPYLETDENGQPVFSDDQIQHSIEDLQIVNSRAGLYVWLNACLYSRPFTDDSSMLTYLQSRYSGDTQAMIVGYLTACFDVLTNVFRRQESEQSIKVVRSFICNKIPTQLSIMAGSIAPAATLEAFIQLGFSTIMMDALPPISTGATEVRERLKETRKEFLQACILHGVMSESAATVILHDSPVTTKGIKYTKDGLLAKYAGNVSGMEPLLDELDGMQGNAGAISACIVETIGSLCLNKDTISLKNLCNALIKRIPIVDIIMQYTDPVQLLSPLCTQLNTWTHDHDQMEFTPAYEEFASILLFILAVVHRYDLKSSDMGLQNDETFVSKLIREISISKLPGDLTPEQSGQLSKWIEGLFATEDQGDIGGISDDIMRPCPPQAFYQLVPTLFEQSVLAYRAGALSMKAFMGGLELLVEPFLLPSLVGGLSWVIKQSWEDHDDAQILLQVLDKLLKPSTNSQETKAMHKTILGIVAGPLYHSLQQLNERKPGKKEVGALMDILKPVLDQDRTPNSNKAELSEWMPTPGGLTSCLRNVIREQIAWVTNVGPTPPPKYTHALFFAACEAIGVEGVLEGMIAELREQTSKGNGSYALDVCTAMICAPSTSTQLPIMSLTSGAPTAQNGSPNVRDTLRPRVANPQKLLHLPAANAEATVRLARRVEAQLAVTQMPQNALQMPIEDHAADQIMKDLGLTDGHLAAPGQDGNIEQVTALDTNFNDADLAAVLNQPIDPSGTNLAAIAADTNAMTSAESQNLFEGLDLDLDQSLTQMQGADGSNANVDPNEEDIFAGLDINMDDFGFN